MTSHKKALVTTERLCWATTQATMSTFVLEAFVGGSAQFAAQYWCVLFVGALSLITFVGWVSRRASVA